MSTRQKPPEYLLPLGSVRRHPLGRVAIAHISVVSYSSCVGGEGQRLGISGGAPGASVQGERAGQVWRREWCRFSAYLERVRRARIRSLDTLCGFSRRAGG